MIDYVIKGYVILKLDNLNNNKQKTHSKFQKCNYNSNDLKYQFIFYTIGRIYLAVVIVIIRGSQIQTDDTILAKESVSGNGENKDFYTWHICRSVDGKLRSTVGCNL